MKVVRFDGLDSQDNRIRVWIASDRSAWLDKGFISSHPSSQNFLLRYPSSTASQTLSTSVSAVISASSEESWSTCQAVQVLCQATVESDMGVCGCVQYI
jgi:hypothetical protein